MYHDRRTAAYCVSVALLDEHVYTRGTARYNRGLISVMQLPFSIVVNGQGRILAPYQLTAG